MRSSAEGEYRVTLFKHWPIVHIIWHGDIAPSDFRDYLATLDRYLLRKERHAYLVDASTAGLPTAAQSRGKMEWLQKNDAILRQLCVAGAFIFRSPVMRSRFAATVWLQPLPYPHIVRSDVNKGVRWLILQLRRAGVRPHPAAPDDAEDPI